MDRVLDNDIDVKFFQCDRRIAIMKKMHSGVLGGKCHTTRNQHALRTRAHVRGVREGGREIKRRERGCHCTALGMFLSIGKFSREKRWEKEIPCSAGNALSFSPDLSFSVK